MKKEELVKGLAYLGSAFNKEYTQLECEQHYDFLQGYSYQTFVTAIKNIIRTNKFLPKISELIEACEGAKSQVKFEVLEYMNNVGYFKDHSEYDKTTTFMERGIIPEWLQEDINTYYKQMISNRLEHQEQKLIG